MEGILKDNELKEVDIYVAVTGIWKEGVWMNLYIAYKRVTTWGSIYWLYKIYVSK